MIIYVNYNSCKERLMVEDRTKSNAQQYVSAKGAANSEMHCVRARTEDDPQYDYYASNDGNFVKHRPTNGGIPLHRTPIRDKIRVFTSKEDAIAFVNKGFPQMNFCYIGVEPVGPSFENYINASRITSR